LRAWKKKQKSELSEVDYSYLEFVTKYLSFTPYPTTTYSTLVLVSVHSSQPRIGYTQFIIQKKTKKGMSTEIRYKKPLVFVNVPTGDPQLAHRQAITYYANYISTVMPLEKLSKISDECIAKLPMVHSIRPKYGALVTSPVVLHDAPALSYHQVQLVYEYEYYRTVGDCVVCLNSDMLVVKHHDRKDCYAKVCYACYASISNNMRQNLPIPCPYCKSELRIASPAGPTGFHWSYVSGTSTHEVQEYFIPVIDRPFASFKCSSPIVNFTSDYLKNYFTDAVGGKKLKVFDFLDPQHYDMKFPNKGSAGFVFGVENNQSLTKREAYPHVHKTLMTIMTVAANYIRNYLYDDAYSYLNKQLINVCKMHLKVEIRCPERVNGEWSKKEKGRVFFISDFISYLIAKPFIAPLVALCGTDIVKNVPIAIGMRFDRGSCTEFLCDFLGISHYNFVNSLSATSLCKQVMSKWRIVEFDFKKFDVHLLAHVLVVCMNVIFSLYDCPSTFEACQTDQQRMFFLVSLQFLNSLIAKIVNVPDGRGWFEFIGLMLSGKYETAYLNSVCNWFMSISTLCDMYTIEVVRSALKDSVGLRFKMFGDDNLTALNLDFFPNFSSSRFTSTMRELFGMVISDADIKVHDHIFRNCCNYVGVPNHDYPTFLKYSFMYRSCYKHGAESYFFRDTDLSLPKLFNSATHVLTPPLAAAKALCFAYCAGSNFEIYEAASAVYFASKLHCTDADILSVFDVRTDLVKKAIEFALEPNDLVRFPSHSDVMDRFACHFPKSKEPFVEWEQFRVNELNKICLFNDDM